MRRSALRDGFVHQPAGEILTDDQIIDIRNQLFDAGIRVIEVGDDGNARLARPGSGLRGSGCVVAVDMQNASIDDPFAAKIGGPKNHLVVALANDSALAGSIDEDDVVQAGSAGDRNDLRFDADAAESILVQARRVVVAELANVACAQAPCLAGQGRDGGGHLAAWLC